ncbi:MAG TPA: IS200/IS605 family transposase [Lentimicrobium sp.]|nr:IS200/IS605 family transposase [Lentimicrobium sp.]
MAMTKDLGALAPAKRFSAHFRDENHPSHKDYNLISEIFLIFGAKFNITTMSFVKIMVHAVWATKSREPYMNKEIRQHIIDHIYQNGKLKGIYIDRLNGYTDHMHCLLELNPDMSISKALGLLKGESAFWINKERLTRTKFEWADEYFATSVSESIIPSVRDYIEKQESHHQKKTFEQEYNEFIHTFFRQQDGK